MYRIYTEKTVDDAVAKGLNELGVTEDDIKIEVIDGGSGGFLGFGKRDAEVQLTVINPELKTYGSIEEMIEQHSAEVQEEPEAAVEIPEPEPVKVQPEPEITEEADQPEIPEAEHQTAVEHEVTADAEDEHTVYESPINNAADDTADYISRVVHEMNIPNETEVSIKDTTVTIEFHAELAAKIIGKRGQTLNALQELAQNYFNTIYKSYGTVFLDVENYREKRRETLESLAINMSKKAMRTNEPVKMEPMPSFERKTMHHVLSRIKNVETYSEGREPNRYLVIIKK
ncbi:Jag protein [Jeotgalicoccus coquinae]|uniref:RNA-binding protein KhpB n=1 Tax=Jeotgalicoccus coquinae TaxID=709509 RepID=A0A6V7R199_9STAP|nr:RNA-binding cell elongation regulator Jag/EloR [Jeotgalicoccus coquinae]MBB6423684.1 spoIIIJ-associated protein [Jeotgalicoccus coquinae]GGE21828.1 Jag protein [Jeotgalicoccus coquinae]CAD2071100.1 R3H domain protein [Jeotgalicoccus coquinae]